MYKALRCLWLLAMLQASVVYSWNAEGHRLVAYIAYHHMTPQAKAMANRYNRQVNGSKINLINAAVWLDYQRGHKSGLNLNTAHYVDLPYTTDGTTSLPKHNPFNAIMAIEQAKQTLSNPKGTGIKKGIALRILLHVVGDLHQPLHAITRISKMFPLGDHGGNLIKFQTNSIAKNLHAYWDNGAGYLLDKNRVQWQQIKIKADDLEKKWPCKLGDMDLDPAHWAQESHALAISYAYVIDNNYELDAAYQQAAKLIVEKQIALAGCRLAAVLNNYGMNTK